MLDIHCHVLPQVDDGARNMEECLRMLDAAREAGIDRMVATPHLRSADAPVGGVMRAYERVRPEALRRGIDLWLGFEINWRALAGREPKEFDRFRLGASQCILVELPETAPLPNWEHWIGRLCQRHTVIIAHPERCRTIIKQVRRLTQMGCEMALDAEGLFAPPFSDMRRAARRLYRMGLADYVVSDAHRAEDYELFVRAAEAYPTLQNASMYNGINFPRDAVEFPGT